MTEKLPAVSLFSNCGAGDVGYAQAGFGFEVMAELDERRMDVCTLNHDGIEPVPGDLQRTWEVVASKFEERRQAWSASAAPGGLSLLSACPPCQGMSSARNDLGKGDDPDAGSKDPRNLLVTVIASVAQRLNPSLVVVENVPQFLTRQVRHPETNAAVTAASYLTHALDDAGYAVYPIVTDLADFGVPQSRRRAFLTFVRRDLPAFKVLQEMRATPYPVPQHGSDRGGEAITIESALTALDAGALDALTNPTSTDHHGLHAVPTWDARQYDMVKAIPVRSGASAWENRTCENGHVSSAVDTETLLCPKPGCNAHLLRPIVHEKGESRFVKGFRNSSYRRMRHDAPASTVTTASGRVGSDVTLHPWEHRVLSPWECQALQTIPQDFKWGDAVKRGLGTVRAMIGEAVPPHFTKLHGEVLAKLLQNPHQLGAGDLLPATDPRHVAAAKRLFLQSEKTQP